MPGIHEAPGELGKLGDDMARRRCKGAAKGTAIVIPAARKLCQAAAA